MNAISLPTRSETSVSSWLAPHEAFLLVAVLHEGADHPDAGDLLAQHPVDRVDLRLHAAELRSQPAHQQDDHGAEQRHHDQQQRGQRDVLVEGHQHAAEAHDRRGDHQVEAHQDQHLDLLHVVGGAGDQGGRAELPQLAGREALHPVEDRGADVAADRHRGPRAVVHRADRAGRLDQGDGDHHRTDLQDVAGVALHHAVVDDVGVQGRQVERCDGGDQLEQHQQGDRSGVGLQMGPEQSDQHWQHSHARQWDSHPNFGSSGDSYNGIASVRP